MLVFMMVLACVPEWAEAPADEAALAAQLDAMVGDHTRFWDGESAPVVAAIVADGEVLAQHVQGSARPGASEPLTARTPLPLASATKVLTTIAVMQLVEEGALSLHDPVTELLPGLPASWRPVTVGMILTHADGLDSAMSHDAWGALGDEERTALDFAGYADYTAELGFLFEPGRRSRYGGQTGFVLLAWIVEELRGMPYEEVLAATIYEPAGMTCTGFGNDLVPFQGAPSAVWDFKEDMARVDLPYAGADIATAALMMCLEDGIALVTAVQDGVLLDPDTFARIAGPNRWSDDWGLGWERDDRRGHAFVGHSGGQNTMLAWSEDGSVGSVFLTNITHPRMLELGYEVAAKAAQWSEGAARSTAR